MGKGAAEGPRDKMPWRGCRGVRAWDWLAVKGEGEGVISLADPAPSPQPCPWFPGLLPFSVLVLGGGGGTGRGLDWVLGHLDSTLPLLLSHRGLP